MADYIYLLETRLSAAQQRAIGTIRNLARESDSTVFLTGGAVRDLTGGGSVRDLDLTLQGDALKLKKALEKAGAEVVGENPAAQQLFLMFPGGVRVELSSAMTVSFPKPGKPKFEPGSLIDSLRSRDFTANAMAISLNEGSYGLLMDPLNGVADIENRELRLVSNYGFIEDPSRLVRAARFMSRLGWQMEEKTRQRYETAKEEKYISALNPWNRGYELEEVFHEEDPVRILRGLESEGWMAELFPALSATKANTTALSELADRQGQLQIQGVYSQSAAVAFPLVTAKVAPADVAKLKALFVRPGFVHEVDSVDARAKEFGAKFAAKDYAAPSAAWKLLYESEPNLVLATFYGSKSAPVQARLKTFLTESPTARQRIPYALMAEMRIVPELPVYNELVEKLFFELMDNKLATPEEMKAYLEPFSPPAPPPPINLRRARARKEAKPGRGKGKKAAPAEATTVAGEEELIGIAEGIMETGDLTGPDRGTEPTPVVPMEGKAAPEAKKASGKKAAAVVEAAAPAAKKAPAKAAAAVKAVPAKAAAPAKKAAVAAKKAAPAPAKKAAAPAPAKKAAAPAKKAVAKAPAKKTVPVKAAAKKVVAKAPAKKTAPAKAVKKAVPAKKAAAKVVAKKAVAKKTVVKAPAKKAPDKAVKKAAPAKKAPAKVAKKAAKKGGRR